MEQVGNLKNFPTPYVKTQWVGKTIQPWDAADTVYDSFPDWFVWNGNVIYWSAGYSIVLKLHTFYHKRIIAKSDKSNIKL